jgi:hypothetical protein
MRQKCTLESIAMTTLKSGKWFYSNKEDKHLTALSTYYNVNIKTERVLIVNPKTAQTIKATKVTII